MPAAKTEQSSGHENTTRLKPAGHMTERAFGPAPKLPTHPVKLDKVRFGVNDRHVNPTFGYILVLKKPKYRD